MMRQYYNDSRLLKPNKDAGDVLHRLGMCGIFDAITLKGDEFEIAKQQFGEKLQLFYFNDHFHRFYEATDIPGKGRTDWWLHVGVSADQLRPVIVACGFFNLDSALSHIEAYLKKHNWWATNTYKNGPERIKKMLPDHAFTLRGVIDRARGEKTKWVEMNDRIALAEVKFKTNKEWIKGEARRPIKRRKIVNWTYREEFVKWHFPLGYPTHDADPTNRVALMVQSQYCPASAQTSTADKARRIYANAEIVVPSKDLKNYDVLNYAQHSWDKYWIRPGDPQRVNIADDWRYFLRELHK